MKLTSYRRGAFARSLLVMTLALAAGALLAGRWAAQAGEPRAFAIRNARIVTVSGAVIEDGTVVVSKGLIVAVGREAAIPPEAWVIDGKGLTVYPGLMDALTDIALPTTSGGGGGSAGGGGGQVATSRGPEDRPLTTPWILAADELKPDDKRIETWRAGGFTSAHTAPKYGIFPGQGAVINLAGERPGQMVVRSPVSLPVNFQRMPNFFNFPNSLMGVLGYIKQVYYDADQDTQAQKIYDAGPRGLERPAYDHALRAIEDSTRAGRPVLLPATTSAQIIRALELAEHLKLRAVLTGALQGYAVADRIAARKVPVLVTLKWPEREKDTDPEAEESLRSLRLRDRAPSTPAALQKAGVKFAFYSDGLSGPKDALKNVKKAIDAGLAPDAALRALTLSPAEIFGVADRMGSIETGKIANLVVTDGDIFEEKTKIKMVFVDGNKFEVREAEKPKDAPKGDMSGKWTIAFSTPEGPQQATADLTMASGGTLTGTVVHPHGTSTLLSGYLSGNSFSFVISVDIGDGPQEVTFSGTLESNNLKGNINTTGFSTEFTATRPGFGRATTAGGE
jgi:hypothetical protein